MSINLYQKIAGIVLAFSLLYFGLYNHYPTIANSIQCFLILTLSLGLIITWVRAKKWHQWLGAFVVLFWILVLSSPTIILQKLEFAQKEAPLTELALLLQEHAPSKGLKKYHSNTFMKDLAQENAYNSPFYLTTDPLQLLKMESLLQQLKIESFELEQTSICFHLQSSVSLRYYKTKHPITRLGDQKITAHWYWVNPSLN